MSDEDNDSESRKSGMRIPGWFLAVIVAASSGISLALGGFVEAWRGGATYSKLATEVQHLRETTLPAMAEIGNLKVRIAVLEERARQRETKAPKTPPEGEIE